MKSLILLSLLVLAPCVQAQETGLITNTEGRKTTSLNGNWRVIIDPYESGFYDYRYQRLFETLFRKRIWIQTTRLKNIDSLLSVQQSSSEPRAGLKS